MKSQDSTIWLRRSTLFSDLSLAIRSQHLNETLFIVFSWRFVRTERGKVKLLLLRYIQRKHGTLLNHPLPIPKGDCVPRLCLRRHAPRCPSMRGLLQMVEDACSLLDLRGYP